MDVVPLCMIFLALLWWIEPSLERIAKALEKIAANNEDQSDE